MDDVIDKAFDFYPYKFQNVLQINEWCVGPTFMVRHVSQLPQSRELAYVPILLTYPEIYDTVTRLVRGQPGIDPRLTVETAKHADACSGRNVLCDGVPQFELAFALHRFIKQLRPTAYGRQESRLYLYRKGYLEGILIGRILCADRPVKKQSRRIVRDRGYG
jgi:hypothetical protein